MSCWTWFFELSHVDRYILASVGISSISGSPRLFLFRVVMCVHCSYLTVYPSHLVFRVLSGLARLVSIAEIGTFLWMLSQRPLPLSAFSSARSAGWQQKRRSDFRSDFVKVVFYDIQTMVTRKTVGIIAGAVVGVPLLALSILPYARRPTPKPNRPPPPLPTGVERVFTPQGLELYVARPVRPNEKHQNKAPIFLQHGGFGTASVWNEWIAYFASTGRTVYALSLSGLLFYVARFQVIPQATDKHP